MVLGNQSEMNDNLIEYVINSQIDLVVSINLPNLNAKTCLNRMEYLEYSENNLPNITKPSINKSVGFERKKIDFKLDVFFF